MTPHQFDLIRVTLRELRHQPAGAAQLFYGRLFSQCPRLRPLFGAHLDLDGNRLFWALSTAIAGLSDPQRFAALLGLVVQPEAREHLRDRDHVAAIGEALQWMLENGLGEFYVAEVHEAWQAAHERFASVLERCLGARLQSV
jgi:hemoglobin-like flavoprotein